MAVEEIETGLTPDNVKTRIDHFQHVLAGFQNCETVRLLGSGGLTRAHYVAVLREIYFHTRENPQIQALATVYFRGHEREMVKPFFRHATSEIGHDQLALNDMIALGEEVGEIPQGQPLPATTALLAYPFYQIGYHGHMGYLGYLYFLEFTPTTMGAGLLQALEAIGVGEEARTFFHDHTTIDVAHNRMMQKYLAHLVRTEEDLQAVMYSMEVTAELYAKMLDAAIASVPVGGRVH